MSFLASGGLLFEQNSAKQWKERGGGNPTEGDNIKPEKERKRLDCVTDAITVLVQPIPAWPWSKGCKLSSIGKMLPATE